MLLLDIKNTFLGKGVTALMVGIFKLLMQVHSAASWQNTAENAACRYEHKLNSNAYVTPRTLEHWNQRLPADKSQKIAWSDSIWKWSFLIYLHVTSLISVKMDPGNSKWRGKL